MINSLFVFFSHKSSFIGPQELKLKHVTFLNVILKLFMFLSFYFYLNEKFNINKIKLLMCMWKGHHENNI